MMKQNIKKRASILIAIMMSFCIISCSDFLEEEPLGTIGTAFFYKDDKDALAALTAAYAKLKIGNGYYRQMFMSNVFAASDQGTSSFRHIGFRDGNIESTDPNLENPWQDIYGAIKDANNVIKNVPEIENINEDLQKRIVGEARFLRALHYFNLVRCFGEVPLRTSPVEINDEGLPKSPITDIYNVIIEDLEYAATNCWGFNETKDGNTNNIGRVTKASVYALLTKVYIQMASSKRTAEEGQMGNERYLALPKTPLDYYTMAKTQADLVLLENGYQLVSNLEDWINLFDASNGNNQEMLFEIQGSSSAEQGTAVSNLFTPRNSGLSGGGWGGTNRILPNFVNNNIDKTDYRFQNSIIREYKDLTNTYVLNSNSTGYIRTLTSNGNANGNLFILYTAKYIDREATTEYTSQQNWHVIRLAEVYLMRAEALAEINQDPILAETDLNLLRTRVGMPNISLSGVTMDKFREEILKERIAELSSEGHRFFDLTRMGVYDQYCRAAFGDTNGARQAEDYVWPIPITETTANSNID